MSKIITIDKCNEHCPHMNTFWTSLCDLEIWCDLSKREISSPGKMQDWCELQSDTCPECNVSITQH